jgi:serine/threonine protein kinase
LVSGDDPRDGEWKFTKPSEMSPLAGDLVTQLLHRDPSCRLSLQGVLSHPFMQNSSLSIYSAPSNIQQSFSINNADDRPLSTKRLRPLKLNTKWGSAMIAEGGDISLETKHCVYWISADGLMVCCFAHIGSKAQLDQFLSSEC